jgi:hypothetical protein
MKKGYLPGKDDLNTAGEKPPEDVKFAAVDDVFKREQEMRATEHELWTVLLKLRNEANREKQAVFGAEKWKKYNAFREEQRTRAAELQDSFTASVEGEQRKKEFRSQQVTDSRSLIKELDVDVGKIESIQERYKMRAQEAIARVHRTYGDIQFAKARPSNMPKLTDNPWTFKYPPFAAQYGWQATYASTGYAIAQHGENRLTGEIGCNVSSSVPDASNSDNTSSVAGSEMRLWFQMPAPGMIEAYILLQSIDNQHNGWLEDEFGFSDASLWLWGQLYMNVGDAGKGRQMYLVNYSRGEDDEGRWAQTVAQPGEYRYCHLYSLQSFAPGQWKFIRIGIWDWGWGWVDDMAFSMSMTNRWLIRWIALRSTGAP